MVKLLAAFVLKRRVVLLELVGVVLIVLALAIAVGRVGVLAGLGVAALVKSFELDLTGDSESS